MTTVLPCPCHKGTDWTAVKRRERARRRERKKKKIKIPGRARAGEWPLAHMLRDDPKQTKPNVETALCFCVYVQFSNEYVGSRRLSGFMMGKEDVVPAVCFSSNCAIVDGEKNKKYKVTWADSETFPHIRAGLMQTFRMHKCGARKSNVLFILWMASLGKTRAF